jgi:hypothetical protein
MPTILGLALSASVVASQFLEGYASTIVSVDLRGYTTISYSPYSVTLSLMPATATVSVVTYSETRPAVVFTEAVTYTQARPTVVYETRNQDPVYPVATGRVEPLVIPPRTPARGYLINNLPAIGLGTWQMRSENTRNISEVIAGAIENGYRHIDCAYAYINQVEIGIGIKEGLRRTGLAREDLWITSKLWNNRHGNEDGAIRETLGQLGLDYLDLFLVHWPLGNSTGATSFDYLNVSQNTIFPHYTNL